MKVLKFLNSVKGIPRFILFISLIIADAVLIYSIYCFLQGGLKMILFSQSVFSLGMGLCAEGVALSMIGDVLLKRINDGM